MFPQVPVSGTKQLALTGAVVDFLKLYENKMTLMFSLNEMFNLGSSNSFVKPAPGASVYSDDPFDSFQAIDPITDLPIAGKYYTQEDIYGMLYSVYKSATAVDGKKEPIFDPVTGLELDPEHQKKIKPKSVGDPSP